MVKMSGKQAFCFVLFLFVVVFSNCKTPFSTREPEEPKTQQSSWIQPTSPSYVMVNLKNAIAEKNITNYLRSLADTSNSQKQFRYVADPAVANANPSLFDHWGLDNEQTFINQLMLFLPKDSTSRLSLVLKSENTFQDSVVLVQDYHLVTNHTCKETECPRVMDGQAEFHLIRTAEDLWYIYLWIDHSVGDSPTWSKLRAYFGK